MVKFPLSKRLQGQKSTHLQSTNVIEWNSMELSTHLSDICQVRYNSSDICQVRELK